jgi:DNA topoisomerase-3
VEEEAFKSEGKVMVQAGWLAVYGKEAQTDDQPNLPPVVAGERVHTSDVRVEACQTKPPARFTEATLLSAMEGAGKLVGDEELREAMADKGLGTPATRAATIDGLIFEQYLNRLGRELQPTAKAFSLIALLQGLGIPELSKPELTGDWEFKLRQIQRGQLSRPAFMAEIAEMTRQIVARAKNHEHDTIPGDFGELKTPCPKCGGVVKETYKKFQCSREGCDFALWKIVAGRQFEPAEIEELLAKKSVGSLAGFRSKLGRPFSAAVRLTPEFKAEFDFGQDGKTQANGEAAPAPDFSAQEPLGKCPKCGGRVFEDTARYVCEHAVGSARTCPFRSGKLILQQPVERAQMTKLLAEGRTDLLTRFISRKGRPFKAFLVVDKDGKVGFEFEKRAPKTKATEAREGRPKEPAAPLDITGQEPVGPCPLCGARVFESAQHYLCEKSQTKPRPCKFKAGKVILQRPITRPEIASLLTGRRTELLNKFTSNKTGRTFSAYLVLGEDGKVGFEFAAREEKAE